MVEEAHWGRDAATFEVVMDAAGPLPNRQLEGLGVLIGQAIAPL